MQTFLPYSQFADAVATLDGPRLGKQRSEVIQMIRALTVPGYPWRHHPAVLMWVGYEEALGRYGLTCCAEWVSRGYADTCAGTITADLAAYGIDPIRTEDELAEAGDLPEWLDGDLPLTHQSSLLRKDFDHYVRYFPEAPRDLEYRWPVQIATLKAATKAEAAARGTKVDVRTIDYHEQLRRARR